MVVKVGVIGHLGRASDIETCTMEKYRQEVYKGYSGGVTRAGPLQAVSFFFLAPIFAHRSNICCPRD